MIMKNKRIAIVIIIFLIFIFGFVVGYSYEKFRNMSDKCHSEGYDGYADVSEFLEPAKYKCYKKVLTDDGYEYEYSDRLNYPSG